MKEINVNLGRSDDDEPGEGWKDVGVPLIRAEDLLKLGLDRQLLRIGNLPPIWPDAACSGMSNCGGSGQLRIRSKPITRAARASFSV